MPCNLKPESGIFTREAGGENGKRRRVPTCNAQSSAAAQCAQGRVAARRAACLRQGVAPPAAYRPRARTWVLGCTQHTLCETGTGPLWGALHSSQQHTAREGGGSTGTRDGEGERGRRTIGEKKKRRENAKNKNVGIIKKAASVSDWRAGRRHNKRQRRGEGGKGRRCRRRRRDKGSTHTILRTKNEAPLLGAPLSAAQGEGPQPACSCSAAPHPPHNTHEGGRRPLSLAPPWRARTPARPTGGTWGERRGGGGWGKGSLTRSLESISLIYLEPHNPPALAPPLASPPSAAAEKTPRVKITAPQI